MPYIDIQLKPSKVFIFLILLLSAGSIAIIFYLKISLIIKVILAVITVSYEIFILWSQGFLLSEKSIIRLKLEKDNSWQLFMKKQVVIGELQGESTATTLLCVLHFSILNERVKKSCVIFKDSLGNDRFRRLVALLNVKPIWKKRHEDSSRK